MSNKNLAILWTIFLMIDLVIFACYVETDRGYYKWFWLLIATWSFIRSIRAWIKSDREEEKINNDVKENI